MREDEVRERKSVLKTVLERETDGVKEREMGREGERE